MAYIEKNLSGGLRNFIIIFTGIDDTANLPLPNAFAVFNLFVERARKASIPPNFFPNTFINGLEMVYNRGFDRSRVRRVTSIVGVNLVFKSLQELGAHLIANVDRPHNVEANAYTEELYLQCVNDLILNFETDVEKYPLLADFFPKKQVPNLEFLLKPKTPGRL